MLLTGSMIVLCVATAQTAAPGQIESSMTTGVVQGSVRGVQTQRPIPSATIAVEGTTLSTTADADGRFTIAGVPVGVIALRVDAAGYAVLSRAEVYVTRGRIAVVTLELLPAENFRDQVTVTASVFGQSPGVATSAYSVVYDEVRRSAGSIGDLSRHLQSLPGLVLNTDQRNDLIARGGSPAENVTRVDHFDVPTSITLARWARPAASSACSTTSCSTTQRSWPADSLCGSGTGSLRCSTFVYARGIASGLCWKRTCP